MNKIKTIEEAVKLVQDGAVIMMGGFGLCGIPENLIRALYNKGTKNLTIISNNAGVDDAGIGILINNNQVKKMIATYIGENSLLEKKVINKEIEIELNPQGTFAERIRAGGAGIGGFYTPTGIGTPIEEGKEKKIINGKEYLLELPLKADFSFIKAYQSDIYGNLVYHKTARNFNPMMATASKCTIVEAEEIVPAGALDPEKIATSGIYVKIVVKGEHYDKRIEKRVYRQTSSART
ncbi:MAG: CoA transferase subunit A [Armatimonadetes bacterium]|nr:CoA transferase subunit A [Armatimonadota bacterium]